jgi:hypothetical protein
MSFDNQIRRSQMSDKLDNGVYPEGFKGIKEFVIHLEFALDDPTPDGEAFRSIDVQLNVVNNPEYVQMTLTELLDKLVKIAQQHVMDKFGDNVEELVISD